MVLKIPALFIGGYPTGLPGQLCSPCCWSAPALWLFAYGSGLIARKNGFAVLAPAKPQRRPRKTLRFDDDEDDDDDGILALGAIAHWWLSARAFVRRTAREVPPPTTSSRSTSATAPAAGAAPPSASNRPSAPRPRFSADGRARVEPEFFAAMVPTAPRPSIPTMRRRLRRR